MRELTTLEIERLDFTGLVPDMNMPERRNIRTTTAKKTKAKYSLKVQASVKRLNKKRHLHIA